MTDPRKPDAGRLLGSLRDALMAASKTDTADAPTERPAPQQLAAPAEPAAAPAAASAAAAADTVLVRRDAPPAAEAVRDARQAARPIEAPAQRAAGEPQTRLVRGSPAAKTQLVRGKVAFGEPEFHQDPVVGWLVVVGGAGLGAFRPIYEGNNSIGRAKNQRIPIDFGDESISSEEQAFIRYDGVDRSFLFVPNLSKTNVVSINNKKPTGAVALAAMDVITMGRTQLAFVPFCGPEFDWSELGEAKG